MAKSGDVGRLSADVGTDLVDRRIFVEAPKLNVSLADLPILRGFVIVEASCDGRPMIGRQSADFLKEFTS